MRAAPPGAPRADRSPPPDGYSRGATCDQAANALAGIVLIAVEVRAPVPAAFACSPDQRFAGRSDGALADAVFPPALSVVPTMHFGARASRKAFADAPLSRCACRTRTRGNSRKDRKAFALRGAPYC